MTYRDRAGDPSGQRAGSREAAGDAGHRQGFRTASRRACDALHRRTRRPWPKTLGNRLYG